MWMLVAARVMWYVSLSLSLSAEHGGTGTVSAVRVTAWLLDFVVLLNGWKPVPATVCLARNRTPHGVPSIQKLAKMALVTRAQPPTRAPEAQEPRHLTDDEHEPHATKQQQAPQ